MPRTLFSEPIHAKERNSPPSADQVLSIAKPRTSHAVCALWPPPSVLPFLPVQNLPRTLLTLQMCQLLLRSLVVKEVFNTFPTKACTSNYNTISLSRASQLTRFPILKVVVVIRSTSCPLEMLKQQNKIRFWYYK